jgi:hypothetical protein
MPWDLIFTLCSNLAVAGWAALIFLPRWRTLKALIRFGVVGILAAAYATLIFLYFFQVEGGGFGSLAQVKTLFQSPPVLLAGWIHYLAFDLFVGVWIAERLDALGQSRPLQAIILAATFMFGPLGLLLAFAPQPFAVRQPQAVQG